jgi:FkbM family methyltransferase
MMPALRRIRGECFWVHPRLLTEDVRDNEPHISQWIMEHLRPGGVLFDVGAHYGWISLKASRHVGRAGRVVAFEPSPVLLEILNYHQARNRLRQMTVVGSAVSETDSAATSFYLLNGGLSSRNSLTIGREGLPLLDSVRKTAADVPTLRLDTFCETEALIPDVIKIDVEGAEGMVLRGAASILDRFRPVLVISMHPHWLPASESTKGILQFAASYGYRVMDSHVVEVGPYEIGDYLLATQGCLSKPAPL